MAARRCPKCRFLEPVDAGEPVWRLGWSCPACGNAVAQRDGIPMFAPELADTVSGFEPADFDFLAEVEANHFWFATRSKLIVGLADKFFPGAASFLEVGCGTGAVLREMLRSRRWDRIAGSELHTLGLVHARTRMPKGVEFVQMDALNIPAVDLFDLTGAFDVVEHIADDEAVLRGLREATRRGGGVILTVPQHRWLWSEADVRAHHQRRYESGELETKLGRNGFEVLFSSSFTALLLPLMAVSRLRARKGGNENRVDREFAMHPLANAVFKAILGCEVRLTLAGLRWPMGGSRVVVARAI
ncbi:class I SAM-dependent methyltransferase [Bradyrhizobium sp.]|uniref:class I SAM-dependent methyltransferase n=1 Tax=Bradyrhizobium sp. TaxID=376 RepID=UPI001DF9B1BC|nr:class I SAM-dependent methyltransferase [Bradyrhizobium sp.]MBI5321111.1 class I SAM-dependent methyltransferase [Bradyrhizobium sp.]